MKKSIPICILSLCVIIAICLTLLFSGAQIVFAEKQQEDVITEQDLYNKTNTYNISPNCFDKDGNFVTTIVENRKDDKQYKVAYDMSARNENEVSAKWGGDLYAN